MAARLARHAALRYHALTSAVPSNAVRQFVSMPQALPLVAGLAAVLVLAQLPDGPATERDRDLVARLTRAGVQRLESDGTAPCDHADAIVPGHPVSHVDAGAEGAHAPPSPAIVPAPLRAVTPCRLETMRAVAATARPSSPDIHARRGRAPPRA